MYAVSKLSPGLLRFTPVNVIVSDVPGKITVLFVSVPVKVFAPLTRSVVETTPAAILVVPAL